MKPACKGLQESGLLCLISVRTVRTQEGWRPIFICTLTLGGGGLLPQGHSQREEYQDSAWIGQHTSWAKPDSQKGKLEAWHGARSCSHRLPKAPSPRLGQCRWVSWEGLGASLSSPWKTSIFCTSPMQSEPTRAAQPRAGGWGGGVGSTPSFAFIVGLRMHLTGGSQPSQNRGLNLGRTPPDVSAAVAHQILVHLHQASIALPSKPT